MSGNLMDKWEGSPYDFIFDADGDLKLVRLDCSSKPLVITCKDPRESVPIAQSFAYDPDLIRWTCIPEGDASDLAPVAQAYCGHCGKSTNSWSGDPCRCSRDPDFTIKQPEPPPQTRQQKVSAKIDGQVAVHKDSTCYTCAKSGRERGLVMVKDTGMVLCIDCAMAHLGD